VEEATDSDAVDEATDTDAVEDLGVPADAVGQHRESGSIKRALNWCGRRWFSLLVAVALVGSAVAAGSVYWWMYRPDQQTNTAAQQQVVEAARKGTTALLSYAPDTIDKDLAAAKSNLTGGFLTYYSEFSDQIVAPAAKQKSVRTEATVIRAAVSEMHPNKAVVLVFVNQVTSSKERPDPALATSSVLVTLTQDHGQWLISEFNPV